jgi:hypothetical protein
VPHDMERVTASGSEGGTVGTPACIDRPSPARKPHAADLMEKAALTADAVLQSGEPRPRKALDVLAEGSVDHLRLRISFADPVDGRAVRGRVLSNGSGRSDGWLPQLDIRLQPWVGGAKVTTACPASLARRAASALDVMMPWSTRWPPPRSSHM